MNEELETLLDKLQLDENEFSFIMDIISRANLDSAESEWLSDIADEAYNSLDQDTTSEIEKAYDEGKDEGYSQGFRDGKLSGSGEYR